MRALLQLLGIEIAGTRLRPWVLSLAGALAAVLAPACESSPPAAGQYEASRLPTVEVRLPDGGLIEAELAVTPQQQAQGLMFRSHLPPGDGMLFVGDRASRRSFWMYQCLIPLDMIWLDGSRRIVEIVREAPPCRSSDPGQCPSYGGTVNSVYVLELAAGQADARGLHLGDRLEF